MYPEYLNIWNTTSPAYTDASRSRRRGLPRRPALRAQARSELLDPTPFSDTDAIAVTFAYAVENQLQSIADLRKVSRS